MAATVPPAARALPPAGPVGLQLRATANAWEKERARLASPDVEERRDALLRLGHFGKPEAARIAAAGLRDEKPIVRATAARSILALPREEAAALLLPLLADRDEFVRREAAAALGLVGSRAATAPLSQMLERDKSAAVRGAAAVALGQLGDETAVLPLAAVLGRRVRSSGVFGRVFSRRSEENEFVRRSAARSLGQLGSRAAVPALVATLQNERAGDDVRREAARALGLIGDPAAVAPLRAVLTTRDPYLANIAHEALRQIDLSRPKQVGRDEGAKKGAGN